MVYLFELIKQLGRDSTWNRNYFFCLHFEQNKFRPIFDHFIITPAKIELHVGSTSTWLASKVTQTKISEILFLYFWVNNQNIHVFQFFISVFYMVKTVLTNRATPSSNRVIPYKSTEKNVTTFFWDFWPKKSKVFDILVVTTFFFFYKILVIFDHFYNFLKIFFNFWRFKNEIFNRMFYYFFFMSKVLYLLSQVKITLNIYFF